MRQENLIPPGSPGVRADLECWADAIEGLHQAVGRVLKAPAVVSAAPLRAAVRRIVEEALSSGGPGKFAEIARVPVAQWLSFRRWLSAPSIQASAGQTIGWLAWAQQEARLPESEFESLLFAAALKDCGLLLLESQHKMSDARLAVERPGPWQSHPLHSAAVAGGLADVPKRVADLVATHHERLDGTGFPHELPAKSQGELSRYFGVACRFVDLFQRNALGTTSDESAAATAIDDPTALPEHVWSAALELQQEVRYGCWDAQWAGAFLNGIVGGLQDRLDELLSDPGQQRQLVLRRRLRRDMAHEGPEPRLARWKSAPETARKKT